MNLAVADVVILARALHALLREGDARLIDGFEDAVSRRVWKAQHFSWWMTEMLHVAPTATDFDRRRQLGELRSVVESESGRRFLAEGYTGWPFAGDRA
jgi:p-hydroxybenzoate 3-monooxygenase